LCAAPWQASDWYKKRQGENIDLEIVQDTDAGEPDSFEVRDLPLSFSQAHRRYAFRSAISNTHAVSIRNESARSHEAEANTEQMQTEHDAFDELEAEDVPIQG
jgi:CRISPR system Cascade subunit CasD